eukprot:4249174-Amphidinium_carterae.1
MTLTVWLAAVLLAAGPSILYSAVKAVPGFLHASELAQWALSQTVFLCTAVLTSIGLPWLAQNLQNYSDAFDLVDV